MLSQQIRDEATVKKINIPVMIVAILSTDMDCY